MGTWGLSGPICMLFGLHLKSAISNYHYSQRIAVYSVLYGRTTTNTPKCLTNGAIYAGIKLCILLLLQSNLYCVTLQGNIEIGSHKTGDC
jgi:hypothetical protein